MTLQKSRKWRFSLFEIFSYIFVAHQILPAFGAALPAILFLGVFTITFIFAINKVRQKDVMSIAPLFLVSFCILIRFIIAGNITGACIYSYGELQCLLFGMIAIVYVNYQDSYSLNRFVAFVFGCYIITAITTGIGCTMYPQAARFLATINDAVRAECDMYISMNIGGFTFIYELTLLAPIIIGLIKTKRISKIKGVLMLLLVSFAIIKSEYTTSLMLFIISVLILIIPEISSKKMIALISLLLGVLVLAKPYMASVLGFIANINPSEIVSSRLLDIAGALNGNALDSYGTSASRIDLYRMSWNAFVDSHGIGTWNVETIGEHSFVIDTIGQFGIIGIVCLVVFYYTAYKICIKETRKSSMHYSFVLVFILTVFLSIMNPKSNIYIYIFMIPLCAEYLRRFDYK